MVSPSCKVSKCGSNDFVFLFGCPVFVVMYSTLCLSSSLFSEKIHPIPFDSNDIFRERLLVFPSFLPGTIFFSSKNDLLLPSSVVPSFLFTGTIFPSTIFVSPFLGTIFRERFSTLPSRPVFHFLGTIFLVLFFLERSSFPYLRLPRLLLSRKDLSDSFERSLLFQE